MLRLMKTLTIACVPLLVGCSSEARLRSLSHEDLCKEIRNEGIRWDGTPFGLQPFVVGEPEKEVIRRGWPCVPALRAALTDESRFAAAHVLLHSAIGTTSYRGTREACVSWNELALDMSNDGTTIYPEGQVEKIRQEWAKRFYALETWGSPPLKEDKSALSLYEEQRRQREEMIRLIEGEAESPQ